MFARKRQIQLVRSDEVAPAPRPGEVPPLKSVSQKYAELLVRGAVLRERLAGLKAELLSADRENRLRIEQEIEAGTREQQDLDAQLRRESIEASADICKQLAPHHRELVVKLATAAIALHSANVEYAAFTDKLDRKGIKWSRLKPAFPAFIGAPKDKTSPLAMFLKQLVSDGFLDRDAMPKEFGGKRQ